MCMLCGRISSICRTSGVRAYMKASGVPQYVKFLNSLLSVSHCATTMPGAEEMSALHRRHAIAWHHPEVFTPNWLPCMPCDETHYVLLARPLACAGKHTRRWTFGIAEWCMACTWPWRSTGSCCRMCQYRTLDTAALAPLCQTGSVAMDSAWTCPHTTHGHLHRLWCEALTALIPAR